MLACLDLEQKNQEEGDVGEKEMEVALKRSSGLLCTMRECAPTERVNCMHVCWVGVNESVHASGHALVHAACCGGEQRGGAAPRVSKTGATVQNQNSSKKMIFVFLDLET